MFHDDPDRMSIDDRLEELVAMLAAGFLRLKRRTRVLPSGDHPAHVSAEKSPEIPAELAGGVAPPSPSCPTR